MFFFSFFEPARLENSVKGIVHPKIKMYSPSSWTQKKILRKQIKL